MRGAWFIDQPWVDNGACKDADVNLFFPEKGVHGGQERRRIAKEVWCTDCPVRSECLEWAIVNERFGVWGGTTEKEREQIRRARRTGEVIPRPGRRTSRCGSDAGYQYHRAHGELVCDECLEARRILSVEVRERRKAKAS